MQVRVCSLIHAKSAMSRDRTAGVRSEPWKWHRSAAKRTPIPSSPDPLHLLSRWPDLPSAAPGVVSEDNLRSHCTPLTLFSSLPRDTAGLGRGSVDTRAGSPKEGCTPEQRPGRVVVVTSRLEEGAHPPDVRAVCWRCAWQWCSIAAESCAGAAARWRRAGIWDGLDWERSWARYVHARR